ncbi:MAG TPA: FeoA family protein [Burkholderiaceae bacterium]|jgi:ferrous iron transport protein A
MPSTSTANHTAHLAMLKKGESATVIGLSAAEGAEQLAIKVRLLELGFAAGEKIRVIAESFPRRDPMAVRVGNTTFALRRAEAAMIQVTPHSLIRV